jgi:hypothetical protein
MIHLLPSQAGGGVEMNTEITLRKKAVHLDLQGTKKTEIARRLNKSRLWVHRWVSRYDARFPEESLQNRSCAPKEIKETYPNRENSLTSYNPPQKKVCLIGNSEESGRENCTTLICSLYKKIKALVLRSRQERQARKRPAYKYALIGAEAIHYELRELSISPLPPARTIHAWLKQARFIKARKEKTRKPPNLTYPVL